MVQEVSSEVKGAYSYREDGTYAQSLRDKQLKDTGIMLFLSRYDPKDGKFRGRMPEGNDEVIGLTPHDDEWDDEWVYWQQDVELAADGKVFTIPCPCGKEVRSGSALYYAVCTRCARLFILSDDVEKVGCDDEEEHAGGDDGGSSPDSGQSGLEAFM